MRHMKVAGASLFIRSPRKRALAEVNEESGESLLTALLHYLHLLTPMCLADQQGGLPSDADSASVVIGQASKKSRKG